MILVAALVLFAALFALSNLYRLIPGGDVANRIAAFEVNTIGLLMSIVLILCYLLAVHPTRTLMEVSSKLVVALLVVLQIWEVGMNVICRAAVNPITADAGGWGVESAKSLCTRTIGPGPLIVQILIGFGIAGYIVWKYRKATRSSG